MKNYKKKINCLLCITISVLLGISVCGCGRDSIGNDKSEPDAISDEINADNTKAVDMTVADKNSEYGVIYYTPSDEEHIASSESGLTKYVDNEILIVADENASHDDIADLAEKYNAEIVGEIEITGDYQLKLKRSFTADELDELAGVLESEELVENAYPNYVSKIATNSVTVSPPAGLNYGDEWRKDVEEYNGEGLSWGWEAIHTNEAWEVLSKNEDKVNKDLRIGLIDGGFYMASPMDLEFAATFYDNSNNGENKSNKIRKHGTHVAGTMAAISDNEKGICGVYPYGKGHLYGASFSSFESDENNENDVSIIAYKIALAELILRDVKVINISMGYDDNSIILSQYSDDEQERNELIKEFEIRSNSMGEYLQRFIDKGYDFVIVNASGNTSNQKFNIDDKEYRTKRITMEYTSAFSGVDRIKFPKVYDRIIVVGSITQKLKMSYFSNGGNRVDAYAPGEKIFSTLPQVEYGIDSGTSMASPHVAGVAAMVWAANSNLTGADVKRIVCESGKQDQLIPDESNADAYLINAGTAVEMAFNTSTEAKTETKPENGAILCWVVDKADEDTKLAGATIEAVDENDETVYKTTSDRDGHFELILPEGTYTLTVNCEFYKDYIKTGVQVTNEGVNYLDDWIKMESCWVVKPEIEADDIIVGDRYNTYEGESTLSSPYVYIKRDGKYGLIDYDGNIKVEPKYDSNNAESNYGLDEFIAVFDKRSGDTVFSEYYNGKWRLNEVKGASGVPGIGTTETTFFVDENTNKLYTYNTLDKKAEAINGGVDASYIVQKINYDPDGGLEKSSATDQKFYLYNEASGVGKFMTEGYKYVYSNGGGACTWSGETGNRVIYDGYTTVAFSNDGKKWDIYDSLGVLISFGLEPFDCNHCDSMWWSPATSFFDDGLSSESNLNTGSNSVPFCATEGYIAVKVSGWSVYLDMDGNTVTEIGVLEDARPVHDGKAWAKYDGKWGVISFDGL